MKHRLLTINEIAKALGVTDRGANKRSVAEKWPYSIGPGKGPPRLYAIHELPKAIQDRLLAAEIERVRASLPAADAPADTPPAADTRPVATAQRRRRDAMRS